VRLAAVGTQVFIESWRHYAACADLPVDDFFPQPGPNMHAIVRAAKRICNTCPVKTDCLEYAMSFDDRALPGIYGGTTETDRRKIHRERMRRVTVRTIG